MDIESIFQGFVTVLLAANLTAVIKLFDKINNLSIQLAKVIQKIGGIYE